MTVGKLYSPNYINSNLYCWQQPSCLYSASTHPEKQRIGDLLLLLISKAPNQGLQLDHILHLLNLIFFHNSSSPVHWLKCSTISLNVCSLLLSPPPFLHQRKGESLRERNLKIINHAFLPRSPFTLHNHLVMTLFTQSDQSIFSSVSSLSKCQQSQAQWCSSPQARWALAIYPLLLE